MNARFIHRRSGLLLVGLAFALVACSGDGDADPTSIGPGSSTDLPPGTDTFLSAAGDVGDEEGSGDDAPAGVDATEAASGSAEDSDGARDDSAVEEGDIFRVLEGSLVLNLNPWRGLQVIDFSNPDAPEVIGRAQVAGHPVEMYVIGDEAWVLLNNWRGYAGGSVHAGEQGTRIGGAIVRIDLRDPMQPEVMETAWVPGWIQRSRVVRSESRGEAALYLAASAQRPVLTGLSCEESLRESMREDGMSEEEIDAAFAEVADEWEGLHNYCNWYRPWEYQTESWVQSWSLGADGLRQVESIPLGGGVTGIQATPQMLMVARGFDNWWRSGEGSEVQLIDIGSTTGEMTLRGGVKALGRVFSHFHMDIHGDILRVVSGSRWGSRLGNFIQTWNIADPDAPVAVDEESFGFENDDLFATLFLGNRAFFVTYERVDPFHAFEITDEGIATEINEFIVSGWNDFFRAVHGETRLIGIGMNDEHGGARAAVSLYDVTDLTNTEPLIARAEVDAQWTWSEANWDHRAFSVLEGAANAVAEDGTPETGLILLPFSGWDPEAQRQLSAVQVFTFSENTLTRRGVMEHGSRVRRSFLADAEDALAGNLSDSRFSLFDLADPDAPRARGTLDVAPNYTHYLPLGGLALRVVGQPWSGRWWDWDDDYYDYGHWGAPQRMEVIETGMHPDVAPALGALTIDRYDHYLNVNGRIVATAQRYGANRTELSLHVHVYSVDDPSAPVKIGSLESEELLNHGWYWGYGCWYCWSWRPQTRQAFVLGDHVLLASVETTRLEEADVPREESCWYEMDDIHWHDTCSAEDGNLVRCERHNGGRNCVRTLPDGEFTCTDWGENCVEEHDLAAGTFSVDCQEPDWSLLRPRNCREFTPWRRRNERTLRLSHVDLSDPSAPAVGGVVEVGGFDRSASFLQDGDTLYHSWAEDVTEDGRAMLRWFIQPWRVVDGELQAGEALNTPGIAMAVQDGMLLSEDRVWQDGRIRAALRVSRIESNRVVLVDSHLFPDREIRTLAFDADEGLILAMTNAAQAQLHYPISPFLGEPGQPTRNRVMSEMIDVRLQTFTFDATGISARGEIAGDHFANLRMLMGRLALFHVSDAYWYSHGGVLVMDLGDPDAPRATAYHPTQNWPGEMHEHDGMVVFPSWRYGLFRIDPREANLLD